MAADKFPSRFIQIFSLLLIVGALVFWLLWGATYGGWNMFDKNYIGVYAIFIVLFAFGVLGLLYLRAKKKSQSAEK